MRGHQSRVISVYYPRSVWPLEGSNTVTSESLWWLFTKRFCCFSPTLQTRKSSRPRFHLSELVVHARATLKSWLRGFLSSCLPQLRILKVWRRDFVVTILRPKKPVEDPKSYYLISLLCVPYKILEQLIHTYVQPIVDLLLPFEQSGFRSDRSTVDQAVLLTQNIEHCFEAKMKAGAMFVNLTAAYDGALHRGLTCKLLRLLSEKHMISMIMELVRNRSFNLTTGNSKRSRLRRLKNGVPQRSVLAGWAPLLFNIYTHDLPSTIYRKYAYIRAFIPRTTTRPTGMGLPRPSWVKLNRLETAVGSFQSSMHKWGLAYRPTSICECGAAEQTVVYIIQTCLTHRTPSGIHG